MEACSHYALVSKVRLPNGGRQDAVFGGSVEDQAAWLPISDTKVNSQIIH